VKKRKAFTDLNKACEDRFYVVAAIKLNLSMICSEDNLRVAAY